MDSVTDIYGPYYKEKGREIRRKSSLSPSAAVLWREMESAVIDQLHHGGTSQAVEEAIDRLLADPGCSWRRKLIEYHIRQVYYK